MFGIILIQQFVFLFKLMKLAQLFFPKKEIPPGKKGWSCQVAHSHTETSLDRQRWHFSKEMWLSTGWNHMGYFLAYSRAPRMVSATDLLSWNEQNPCGCVTVMALQGGSPVKRKPKYSALPSLIYLLIYS